MSYAPARGDIVRTLGTEFPHVHYVITGEEVHPDHGVMYYADRTVAFTDGSPRVFATADRFERLGPLRPLDVAESAERVRAFLAARSQHHGTDPDLITGVTDRQTHEIVELLTADLDALVRSVLGVDAQTKRPRPRRAPVALPADVLAREANAHREDPQT